MKKLRKLWSFALVFVMVFTLLPASAFADGEQATETSRHIVLILDVSRGTKFINIDTNETLYQSDSAIADVKEAAQKFVEDIAIAEGNNQIAIVSYDADAKIMCSFTNDAKTLKDAVRRCSSSTRRAGIDMNSALKHANSLLDSIADKNTLKNVVLLSTGMATDGEYDYEGHYDESTVAADWRNMDTQVRYYAYANAVYEQAQLIKERANLYSFGIFRTFDDAAADFKPLQFFKLLAKDLASSAAYYTEITDLSKIKYTFGDVTEDILNELLDSDGDSFYDDWEINGYDADGDGTIDVDLPAMGADPNTPDIFVEIDWMVRPAKNLLWFEYAPEVSFRPDPDYMKQVFDIFEEHDINLHLDMGPESTDYVTEDTWGTLSGGNAVPYQETIYVHNMWTHDMDPARERIFRHATFCDRVKVFDGNNIFGQPSYDAAGGILYPGSQCFLVGNHKAGPLGVAGTFMHELGHSLDLGHGGDDSINGKPNYLSVMNYYFQLSGLLGTNKLDYSNFVLPDLDENNLNELDGIDPEGITEKAGLGSKFTCLARFGEIEVPKIAKTKVNFNGSKKLFGEETYEEEAVSADITGDGEKDVLTGYNDWENLDFEEGNIRKNPDESKGDYDFISMAGKLYEKVDPETLSEHVDPDIDKAIELGILGHEGAGNLQPGGPYTIIEGLAGQNAYVNVSNLYRKDATFTLEISPSPISEGSSQKVFVPGSVEGLSSIDVAIPIKETATAGEYVITAALKYPGREDVVAKIPVCVESASEKQIKDLAKSLSDETTDVPVHLVSDYAHALSDAGHASLRDFDISLSQIILKIDDRTAKVFGKTVINDVPPIIVNSRTMLPIRFVAEALGASVGWDEVKRQVSITKGDTKILLTIGSAIATVNGQEITLDSAAFINQSRTYLPVAFVAENLGADVKWLESTREVVITKK